MPVTLPISPECTDTGRPNSAVPAEGAAPPADPLGPSGSKPEAVDLSGSKLRSARI